MRLRKTFLTQISITSPADLAQIEALLDARFGADRQQRTAYRLRDGVEPIAPLCLVARDGGHLLGSVQCWPLQLRTAEGQIFPLILLGPVAVALVHEKEGIGSVLMTEVLTRADALSGVPLLLIGDAPYYGRFGFSAAHTGGWQVPGPVERDRLLLRGDAGGLAATGWLEPATTGRVAG